MLLTIHHRTRYRYARPVWLQPHRMMLRRIASDIARIHPVRGSYVGAPEDFLDMQVEVTVETRSAPVGTFDFRPLR